MERGWRTGPRLPTGRFTDHHESIDPDTGEAVERCGMCKVPHRPSNPVYPGLWGYIHRNAPLSLCERCVRRLEALMQMAADPLTLDEVG